MLSFNTIPASTPGQAMTIEIALCRLRARAMGAARTRSPSSLSSLGLSETGEHGKAGPRQH